MSFSKVQIFNLRNIKNAQFSPSPDVNVIYGSNGSGKTSLLEAVFLLARGKSFRCNKSNEIINRNTAKFSLFAEFNGNQIGMEKGFSSASLLQINGDRKVKAADLIALVPLQIVNYHSFSILEGGSLIRRQFLDWGVFHVEPSFLSIWRQYSAALRQRNAALKNNSCSLEAWDESVASLGQELDVYRKKSFQQFSKVWEEIKLGLVIEDVKLSYHCGWDEERPLIDCLYGSKEKDFRLGYTSVGAHRADISFYVEKSPVLSVLSRGQQKLLVFALRLAQAIYIKKQIGKNSIFLLDDVSAELDNNNREKMLKLLLQTKAQTWITTIEKTLFGLDSEVDLKLKLFHVEHGRVKEDSI